MNMNMNPGMIMKILNAKNTFTQNHPKVEAFIRNVLLAPNGIPEDTIIEITLKRPGEEPVSANMKVLKSDLELFEELKNLGT